MSPQPLGPFGYAQAPEGYDAMYRMQLALMRARVERPYFASALARLRLVENPNIPTACVTDRWELHFSPDFVYEWEQQHPVPWGLVLHELDHMRRRHIPRARALAIRPEERVLDMLAADFEINDDLVQEGVPLHASRAIASEFAAKHQLPKLAKLGDGALYEQYFRALQEDCDVEQCEAFGSEQRGCEGAQADGAGGGGADGEGDGDGDGGGGSGVVGEAEAELIWRNVAKAVEEHAAKGRGTVPAGILTWSELMLAPSPIPWRDLLRAQVRRAVAMRSGASDYTRRKPNRRQHAYGAVLMPGLFEPIPKIAVVFDTSGSMSEHELAQGRAEIVGILQQLGVPCTVLDVDAAVHATQTVYSSGGAQKVGRAGRGGTDMRVGIRAALELKSDVLVVYTDGGTPWPKERLHVPLVALISPNGYDSSPDWAVAIKVDSLEPEK